MLIIESNVDVDVDVNLVTVGYNTFIIFAKLANRCNDGIPDSISLISAIFHSSKVD